MAMATQIFRSPLSPPLSPSPSSKRLRRKLVVPAAAVPISNAQTRERQKMKDMFREARERCVSDPMDGVDFTVEEFHRALDDRDFGTGVGCKIIGGNKGGVLVTVEGLHGFVPFSELSKKSAAEELLHKELPLKFVKIDKKQSQLVLSNCKEMVDNPVQIGIGTVIKGTVRSLKPYGALINVGGLTGLLHVSQISHEHVSDISTVLQPGDTLKVMILSYDHERERLSLSTKKLEPTPGDMLHNPKLVFEKADEIAENFKRRIAWVEEMASAELLGSQPEVEFG